MIRLGNRVTKCACFFLLLLLVCSSLPSTGAAAPPDSPSPRIVAIGDIHGDYNDFLAILQRAGLIDEQHHWAGGKTTFVQVGDEIDRGHSHGKS